jgi:ADP-L-glycero-D-manno-heptose 6-epimerase
VGTGQARTWNDLGAAVFKALGHTPRIEYIEMPEPLRGRYQYHTCAERNGLRAAGHGTAFSSLEAGVADYLNNYLQQKDPYL